MCLCVTVAERVLSRRRLQLGGSELSITPAPVLPKADDRLVHIHGIGPNLDKETLELILGSTGVWTPLIIKH